ncbi:helix-turn-helix transcriptional regulator [Cellulomonas sp. B6]|jgi:putative transcriptional regulator|uniref:helix-turn-helix domain-containing protein n=1 Tax=Cellulomonas sp. B6 TaxID=1295626 RepID=UPI00073C3460|nr:helix-turn-helix transcriptional regulator [Cellulomonas sp. B6]KSW29950.1 XRE family transcriptional regulator [Cellulomonas sp. B6]
MPRKAADAQDAEILCRLDVLLAERGMTLAALSEIVGVSVVNLSVLKNDRAQAVRFSTLAAICDALGCDVGDLLTRAR